MYVGLLDLHNLVRWLVLIAAVVALVNAYGGLLGKRTFERRDRTLGAVFTGVMDLQFLIGLILYFVSPLVQSALQNMSAAMQDDQSRFFAVEHALIMLVAVILAHVGGVLARRARSDAAKFRRQAVWFSLSVLAVLFAIPWPWSDYGRALFPGL